MKIALVGSDPVNGLLLHPVRLATALHALGHDVQVLFSGSARQQAPGLRDELGAIPLVTVPALQFAGVRALAHPFRAPDVDVLHAFGPVSLLQARTRAKKIAMIEAMGHGARSPWPARAGALLLRAADRVIALCAEERERLLAAGVPARKLRVVPNPIDCDDLLARAARGVAPVQGRVVACLANFQKRKRHDLVLEAFERAAPPDALLVLAGEGEERAALERRAGPRVRFVGRLQADAALALVKASAAVLHASDAETFGYSMVEPLLLGTPAAVTRVGIARELEEAGVAEVAPRGDAEALAAALRRALQGPRPGAAAWVRATFDASVVARKLVQVYEEALQ